MYLFFSSQSKDSSINEILIVGLGYRESRPHLFTMLDQDLVVYEAFPFAGTRVDKHLLIRFRKVRFVRPCESDITWKVFKFLLVQFTSQICFFRNSLYREKCNLRLKFYLVKNRTKFIAMLLKSFIKRILKLTFNSIQIHERFYF